MDILLVIAAVVVGASGLYVAVTFNTRTQQNTRPVIDSAIAPLSSAIKESEAKLAKQLDNIGHKLTEIGEQANAHAKDTQKLLRELNEQASIIATRSASHKAAIRQLADQMHAGQEHIGSELQKLNLGTQEQGQSLAAQGVQILGIKEDISTIEAISAVGLENIQGLVADMNRNQSESQGQLAEIISALERQTEMNSRGEDRLRWAEGQMLDVVKAIEMVLTYEKDIQDYLRSRLDYEAARASLDDAFRIVIGSISLTGHGADILWDLFLAWCKRMQFKALYSQLMFPSKCKAYLMWNASNGEPLEQLLSAKLAACMRPVVSTDPDADPDELPSLLLVLHECGPGTIKLGSMIVNRTRGALLGCVLTGTEAVQLGDAATPMSPDDYEAKIRQLDPVRVTDLTRWADAFTLLGEDAEAARQPSGAVHHDEQ